MNSKYLIVLVLVTTIFLGCLNPGYPDILYKEYNVVKIQNTTIDGKNVIIVYQMINKLNPKIIPGNLDIDTKYKILMITYYVFKNTNADEVQIICYYNNSGNPIVYYKFKIDRRDAKLVGLLDMSKDEIATATLYLFDRAEKLGSLWVNDKIQYQVR
ncbi:hypothetical protein ACPB8Q_07350 [Methanocaldococcus indicus]|uniref:hypothetical protein n=1 Tax=Methanocaldococcus indicus TaxID=213231 RepID=UPI003C6D962C